MVCDGTIHFAVQEFLNARTNLAVGAAPRACVVRSLEDGGHTCEQLRPDGRAAIDSEIITRLNGVQKLELVLVTGHTDRIGSQQYNQRLSERRADAVRDYLVSKGVPRDKIETLGMGKTQPVPGVVCNQKSQKELIACLAPNRRVEVEVKGEGTTRR